MSLRSRIAPAHAGITSLEALSAATLAALIAALGFTGVTAFGKSINRAKQLTSETEQITAAMRLADQRADQGYATLEPQTPMPAPQTWTRCDLLADRIELSPANGGGKSVVVIKALNCYRP